MSKISTLPVAGPLTGEEPVIIVQEGQTRQSTIGAVIDEVAGPYVDEAQTARNEAVAALADPYRFVLDTSARQMLLASASQVAFPPSFNPGRILALDPANDRFSYGAYEVDPGKAFSYSRAGTAEAIGGGSRVTFADNELPIHDGKLFVDAGGTNLLLHTEDFANAIWTKERITLAPVAGPAGAGTATRITPTTDNNTHILRQTCSSVTDTVQVLRYHAKADGYSKIRLAIFGNNGRGGRADFDLVSGTVSNVFGHIATAPADAATAVMWQEDDGWMCEVRATLGVAPTSVLEYVYVLNDSSAISFAGDGIKGVIVAAPMAQAGVSQGSSYIRSTSTRGTRSAATLTIAPPPAFYILRTVDALGERLTAFQIENYGDAITLAPRANGQFSTIELFVADLFDDFSLRADTADGQLGTSINGRPWTMLTIDADYPMIPATFGRISGGGLKITPTGAAGSNGKDRTFYAVQDAGKGLAWNTVAVEYSFGAGVAGAGVLKSQVVCLLLSRDPADPGSVQRLIFNMPAHIVAGRDLCSIQYRATGEDAPFPQSGQINHLNFPTNGSRQQLLMRRFGNKLRVSVNGVEVVCQEDIFDEDAQLMAVEITSESGNTNDTATIHKVWGSTQRIGDVPVYVAAPPIITTAVFLTPSDPPSYKAGCLLTPNPAEVAWISNAGPVTITANQFLRNGINIAGATGGSHRTVSPADVGAVFELDPSYTNNAGTTVRRSRPTNPLIA